MNLFRHEIVGLFFVLSTFLSYSQTPKDYEIYNSLINENIKDAKRNNANLAQIVLSNKLTKFSKRDIDEQFIRDIADDDTEFYRVFQISSNVDYPDSINIREIKKLINGYSENVFIDINLNKRLIEVDAPHIVINSKKIEKLFMPIFKNYKTYQRRWKRFNKKYSNSYGYHEFGAVNYSENFAIVYEVWRFSPLGGNGILCVLKRSGNSWVKNAEITLWNN